MSFLLDDGQNGKKITSMLLSGNSDGIALQECIVWAGNTITLFEAKQRKKTQKHPGGLFSARVGAWLYKERLCCEQQKNVEILMVL